MTTEARIRAHEKWKASTQLKRVEILLPPSTLAAVSATASILGIPRTRFIVDAVETALSVDRTAEIERQQAAARAAALGGVTGDTSVADPVDTGDTSVADTGVTGDTKMAEMPAPTPAPKPTQPPTAKVTQQEVKPPKKRPADRGHMRGTSGRIEAIVVQARKDGKEWAEVADLLNKFGLKTARGKVWRTSATEAFARRRSLK